MFQPQATFRVAPQFQPMMRMLGLDAEGIFTDPRIVCWRKLADRENCTLDAEVNGEKIRWHIKRFAAAGDEVEGLRALEAAGIPTVTLIGWAKNFVITEHLEGYEAADKVGDFEKILEPTADLAAKLH